MTVGLLSFVTFGPFEGLVASRARVVSNALDTTNKFLMGRSAHIASENLSSIKIAIPNFNIAGGSDAGSGAAASVTAAIEFNGTFTQVTFASSTSGSVPNNSVLFSDFASVSIPAGSTFWVRIFWHSTGGTFYNSWQNSFLGEAVSLSATTITDQTMGGTITNSGSFSFPPVAILGITRNLSVIIAGDSIDFGALDVEDSSASATGFNAKVGIIARSLGNIPFLNIAVAGESALSWPGVAQARSLLIQKGSHLVTGYGANDIAVFGSSAAVLATSLQAIWSLARGGQKIFQRTLIPRTTSTDGWATLANQIIVSGNVTRVSFNTNLRGAAVSGLNGFFDATSALESGLNSGLWNCPVAGGGTAAVILAGDGLHPSPAGYGQVASSGVVGPFTWP